MLQHLAADSCLVGGGSSGGPHALACAARLDAAQAVLVVGSHAPFEAEGLDYLAGMGDDNITEYSFALKGEEALRAHLLTEREDLLAASIDGLVEALSSLLPDVDRAALTDEFGEDVMSDVQEALRTGVDGWVDDALAFVKPWGFDLDEIAVPTTIWHGSEDQFNPIAHARWLAANVPDAAGHFLEGAGHLSTWQASPSMLDELLANTHDRTR